MKPFTFHIVGLSGASQQGKSTVAVMLHKLAGTSLDLETSDQVMLVANRWLAKRPPYMNDDFAVWLKSWLQRLEPVVQEFDPSAWTLGAGGDTNLNRPLHEYIGRNRAMLADPEQIVIDRANKLEHVLLLQWLGAYARLTYSQDFWQNMHRHALKQAGSKLALATIGGIRFQDDADFIHSLGGVVVRVVKDSETSDNVVDQDMHRWEPDVLVHNNGSLTQLQTAVEQLWGLVQTGQLKPGQTVLEAKNFV